jgi:hypothetical protein
VKVNVEVVDWDNYWTLLEAGASGGTMPDVFWMHSNTAQMYMDNDVLLKLNDYIEKDSKIDMSKYYEGVKNLYTRSDGNVYALPKDHDTIALLYNKAIFDKYKGQDFLLDICDGAKDEAEIKVKYEGFLQRMDRGLKKIGPYTRKGLGGKKHIKPILPGLSQYWSRHTTATLMANMGYREEIIVCSLGHEHKNKTTNIYIEYNEVEVDKANRALIDFVNSNDMDIQLNEKVAGKAKELAKTMGMSEDELVNKIVQWYFEDNEKDDTFAGEEL